MLLFALLLQVLTYPFLDDDAAGRAAIAVFDLAILALALSASRAGGRETWVGYMLVVPAMVLHAAASLGEEGTALYATSVAAQAGSMRSSSACCVTCCAASCSPWQCYTC